MINYLLAFVTKVISVLSAISLLFSSSVSSADAVKMILGGGSAEEKANMISSFIFHSNLPVFEKTTEQSAQQIIYAVALQFLTGDASQTAVTDVLDALPTEDITHENKAYYSSVSEKTLLALADKLQDSELPKNVADVVALYGSGINDLYIYLQSRGDGEYEFMGSFVDDNGNTQYVASGAYYNSKTGLVYGKNQKGIFSIGYDYDAKQYMLQNPNRAWMRYFGFNLLYDMGGNAIFMDTDTARVKYEVQGKRYMIQFWKGHYTDYSNGAEVGVYYLKDGANFFYSCGDEYDMMPMSFTLYDGDNVILTRDTYETWWLSGYRVGPLAEKENMILKGTIEFPAEENAVAFTQAANQIEGFSAELSGTAVNYIYR